MSNNINTNISSGILKFTFTDSDGEVISSFRMNPADVRLASRCEEVSEYFEKLGNRQNDMTIQELSQLTDEIEEKISYLLGYDAKSDLFSNLGATTILPSGDMFVILVMDTISNSVKPEMEKRIKKMSAAMDKYTSKYDSVHASEIA